MDKLQILCLHVFAVEKTGLFPSLFSSFVPMLAAFFKGVCNFFFSSTLCVALTLPAISYYYCC